MNDNWIFSTTTSPSLFAFVLFWAKIPAVCPMSVFVLSWTKMPTVTWIYQQLWYWPTQSHQTENTLKQQEKFFGTFAWYRWLCPHAQWGSFVREIGLWIKYMRHCRQLWVKSQYSLPTVSDAHAIECTVLRQESTWNQVLNWHQFGEWIVFSSNQNKSSQPLVWRLGQSDFISIWRLKTICEHLPVGTGSSECCAVHNFYTLLRTCTAMHV